MQFAVVDTQASKQRPFRFRTTCAGEEGEAPAEERKRTGKKTHLSFADCLVKNAIILPRQAQDKRSYCDLHNNRPKTAETSAIRVS